jgi:hypothetical protein
MLSTYQLYNSNNINTILLQEGLIDFKLPNIPKNFNFKKSYNDIQNKSLSYLNKYKITKQDINKLISKIKKDYSSTNDPKKAADVVLNTSVDFIKERFKSNKEVNVKEDSFKFTLPQKVITAILITLVVYLINTFTMMLIPPPLGVIICVGFTAPIIEEYAKRLAIQSEMPWIFAGVFSGIEFFSYVFKYISIGVEPIQAIILRLSPIILHFYTTWFQKLYHDASIRTNKPMLSKLGFFIAVFLHMFNNLIALIQMGYL